LITKGNVDESWGVWEIKVGRDDFAGFSAADHRDNLDRSARAPPLEDPLLKEAEIAALHELKAPRKIGFNPAIHVLQTLRQHPATVAKPSVDGDHVIVLEMLD
jgi:hypothetical protein